MTRPTAIVLLALALPALVHAAEARPGAGVWTLPDCARVVGSGAVTFTADEGNTLAPTVRHLRSTGYTMGLVALDVPNTLLAVHNRSLLRSADAGCRWSTAGTIATVSDGFPVTLAAAPGGRAYGWSDNRNDLVRIDGTSVTYLISPVDSIVGLAADPLDGDHVRLGGRDGTVWESVDAGIRWGRIGTSAVTGFSWAYRIAFDPADLDHIVAGTVTHGALASADGADTWTPATGLSATAGPVNVFSAVISPADGGVVWAMGLDLDEADAGAPSGGRHIYRSVDGGLTFAPVVDRSAGVTLVNGPLLAAHPVDPDVLYFVFGTGFANYGTDLFRYDAATSMLSVGHNGHDGVPAIAFSPADPAVMYLGLAEETISARGPVTIGGSR